jgi:hypothetical protein
MKRFRAIAAFVLLAAFVFAIVLVMRRQLEKTNTLERPPSSDLTVPTNPSRIFTRFNFVKIAQLHGDRDEAIRLLEACSQAGPGVDTYPRVRRSDEDSHQRTVVSEKVMTVAMRGLTCRMGVVYHGPPSAA